MLGLGLGSLLGGKLSKLQFLPLLILFGVLEIGIGLFGISSLQLFDFVGSFTINLSYVQMTLVAFLLVLVPTLSMGATLPILSAFLIHRQANVGLSLGSLYFVNTLGSAIAAFSASLFLMSMLGMQGTIYLASILNFLVGTGALLVYFLQNASTDSPPKLSQESHDTTSLETASPMQISFQWILLLAFASGFVALSYEILWMRIFSIANAGVAFIFPRILGLFLLGLALGSYIAGRVCETYRENTEHITKVLRWSIVIAVVLGFLLMPIAAFLATKMALLLAELYLLLAALVLGVPFPLLAHIGIQANKHSGEKISYMYMANIAGATIGTVLTGFILMDHLPSQTIALVLALIGLGIAALLPQGESTQGPTARAGFALLALLFLFSNSALSTGNYEKFQTIRNYNGQSFKQLVETKSGVISVTENDQVYGGGVYDGRFNTSLINDSNGIVRPYVLSAFHPAPKKVLMIGLATGSWAQVVAHHPDLEELVVVEINPGYLEVVNTHERVESLLSNHKVKILIDDGRRYLQRNENEKFDLIIMNTTFHWRAYAANLLSKDFLEIVLAHLNENGIAFYNSTNSMNVQKTGATVCLHALRFQNHMLCSNEPFETDIARLESILWEYEIDGVKQHDPDNEIHVARITETIRMFDASRFGFNTAYDFETFPFEARESILRRTAENFIITDDNMGDEWN